MQHNHLIVATWGLALLVGCAAEPSRRPALNAEVELERALQKARTTDKAVLVFVSGPG